MCRGHHTSLTPVPRRLLDWLLDKEAAGEGLKAPFVVWGWQERSRNVTKVGGTSGGPAALGVGVSSDRNSSGV